MRLCVCLFDLRSLFPFEGNLILARRARRPHLHVCVHPCAYDRIFVFSLAFYVCFWSWGLVCWQVVCVRRGRGGQWPFWDRHKIRVWERGSEREGLFHVTLHSTKAQAGRGTRQDMRPPPSLPHLHRYTLPSVPSLHPSPLSVTLTFIKKPHAGIPLQHLCVGARVQRVHVQDTHVCTHVLVRTWRGADLLVWNGLGQIRWWIKKQTNKHFFAFMKPTVAWSIFHGGPR